MIIIYFILSVLLIKFGYNNKTVRNIFLLFSILLICEYANDLKIQNQINLVHSNIDNYYTTSNVLMVIFSLGLEKLVKKDKLLFFMPINIIPEFVTKQHVTNLHAPRSDNI